MTTRSALPTDDPLTRIAPSEQGAAAETRQLTELARGVGSGGDVDQILAERELMLETTRCQLRQAEALLEIARSLSSTLEIRPLLKTLTQQTASACEMERCSIYLWDGGRILPVMSQFADGRRSSPLWKAFQNLKALPLEEVPFFVEAVERLRPVVIHDACSDPRVGDTLAVFALKSLVIVPLVRRGKLVGAMSLDTTDRVRKIAARQLSLAEAIAGQLTQVLENVENYQRAQDALEELRAAQERLVQSEKARALAEMAGGVAHDFNSLLAAILGRTQVLIREVDAGSVDQGAGRRHLGVIEQAARDGAETVRRLLELTCSKPRHGDAEAVDVHDVLRHSLEVLRPCWNDEAEAKSIAVETVLELGEVPPALASRPLRVLVVDDEPSIRELLGEVLAIDGHLVWKAGSGPEGVEVLEREDVDLVLTDLGMPGMTGWDVAAYVKGRWPGVKVGLISGWGTLVEPDDVARHGIDFLCSKPFEMQELLSKLATL